MNLVNDPPAPDKPGPARSQDDPAPRQATWFGVEAGSERDGRYIGVVFNRPIDQVFTYRATGELSGRVQLGQRLLVPLGKGSKGAVGYCVEVDSALPEDLEPGRVRDVLEILDPIPLLDRRMLELTRWMADYYACAWGQALDAVVPAGVRRRAATRFGVFLVVPEETREALASGALDAELTPKQKAAVAVLMSHQEPLTPADLGRLAGCKSTPIKSLIEHGRLHTIRRRIAARPKAVPVDSSPAAPLGAAPDLTHEQAEVLERLKPALDGEGFAPFLIHGVTGSGKTEIYLSAIERVVARGREAIVLVPEISLTPQTIRRFRRRFSRVAVLHSHMGDAERTRQWQNIAAGQVEVVVGARSAIFAPARRLGLIVIDEEHETSFKQESTPRYHARDLAVKRASLERIPILLGSATPSLESWHNADIGRYTRLEMPSRVGGRAMPEVEIIDLRGEKTHAGGLSESLRRAMTQALDDGGQVILLLNRRGYHTFVLCPRCGQVVKCASCDVAATYHRDRRSLVCHMCNAERPPPAACPHCKSPRLHYGGIGTERLEREIATLFPGVAAARMDSDTMTAPGSHETTLAAFKAGEIRILMGTQMIAKGLDFPNVTLVGVVNADVALHLPDFRAAERTFQLTAQVAGRTGRGDRPGRVLIQTYAPDHPAISLAARHDYAAFAELELAQRASFGVPPFGRLARLVARGPREAAVNDFMTELAQKIRDRAPSTVRLLGPAPAPILKIKDLYRVHAQLRAPTVRPIQVVLKEIVAPTLPPAGVELSIDVDPISML